MMKMTRKKSMKRHSILKINKVNNKWYIELKDQNLFKEAANRKDLLKLIR